VLGEILAQQLVPAIFTLSVRVYPNLLDVLRQSVEGEVLLDVRVKLHVSDIAQFENRFLFFNHSQHTQTGNSKELLCSRFACFVSEAIPFLTCLVHCSCSVMPVVTVSPWISVF
jgi:hypothetical protein